MFPLNEIISPQIVADYWSDVAKNAYQGTIDVSKKAWDATKSATQSVLDWLKEQVNKKDKK